MQTLIAYVENKPGVLNRVSSLFRRRAFNIESLTVGHTETAGVSRMTVVVDTDDYGARRLEAHLYKLVPVLRVDNRCRRRDGIHRAVPHDKVSDVRNSFNFDLNKFKLPRGSGRRCLASL